MKAAIYIRVSTHHQIDRESLPFQRKDLANYCEYALNITDYEIFEDAGYSAKNTDRPRYQEMMKRIRKGEFTHLIVWKIDRISRNLLDFASMWEELKEHEVTFISKNEQFDTSTAMGEAMLKIILVFAELERKLTAERVMSIMLSRAEKGLWNGAPVPIGYDWDDEAKCLRINDAEAAVVRLIYNLYEEHGSTLDVLRYLRMQNVPTKRGGRWTAKTVRDVLRSPTYKGTLRYNYQTGGRGKTKNENEWILVDDALPAIVRKSQWELVQKMLDENYKGTRSIREKAKHTHIFSGLLKCGKCGAGFLSMLDRPRKDGFRPSTYRCATASMLSKGEYRACAGFVSDVKMGPFIFQYLRNLVKAADAIRAHCPMQQVEHILLKGMPRDLVGIRTEDLSNTVASILGAAGELIDDGKRETAAATIDTQLLSQSRARYERALERLDRAYLFDDAGMSEKDYLVHRKELQEKLAEVNHELRKIHIAGRKETGDVDFIKRASRFLMSKQLLAGDSELDFVSISRRGCQEGSEEGKKLLKTFFSSVITQIEIQEKRVSAIQFEGGITHRFVYR